MGSPRSFGPPDTRKLHNPKAGLETTLAFQVRGTLRTQLMLPLTNDPLPSPLCSPATQMLQRESSNTTHIDQISSSSEKVSSLLDYQIPSFASSTITQALIQEERLEKRKKEKRKKKCKRGAVQYWRRLKYLVTSTAALISNPTSSYILNRQDRKTSFEQCMRE